MSGTRSLSRTAPATRPSWRLMALLWPFATAAVAIGLIGLAIGLPSMHPVTALWLSLPLGLPATWAAARWVSSLIARAGQA